MKNIRGDHPNSHTYLASKRASLNHDKLPQPYKIEWGDPSIKNSENRAVSSKNFFQNMKDELSNIKTDFQKLIKKQNSFSSATKPVKQESLYSTGIGFGSGNKGKSLSSYKKEHKKMVDQKMEDADKMNIMMSLYKVEENHEKTYKSQKQDPYSQKKGISKTVNMKETSASNPLYRLQNKLFEEKEEKQTFQKKVKNDRVIDLPQRQIEKNQSDNQKLKKEFTEMTTQINILKKEKEEMRKELESQNQINLELRKEKEKFIEKMTELSTQLQNKLTYIQSQQTKISQLYHLLDDQRGHHSKHTELVNQQIQKERTFYKQKINQLLFHNQNFDKVNMELGSQNEQLKENLANIQNFVEHLKKINENTENDYKRKLQFMKKDVEQYKKRQTMLEKQIEKKSLELRRWESEPQHDEGKEQSNESEMVIQNLKIEVDCLNRQIEHLRQEIVIQKETVSSLRQKYQQEVNKSNLQEFKNTVQKNMNQYVQENSKLKTKINNLTAEIDSLKEQNHSLSKEIQLYQQRQKGNTKRNQMSSSEWEELTEKIEHLTQENEILKDKLELRTLKDEVQRQVKEYKAEKDQNLIKVTYLQLEQIQKLKNQIKNIKSENDFLRKELQVQGETCLNLKKHFKNIEKQSIKGQQNYSYLKQIQAIEKKNTQLNLLKNLIFRTMIEKVSKLEEESDLQFWLRKVEELRPLLIEQ